MSQEKCLVIPPLPVKWSKMRVHEGTSYSNGCSFCFYHNEHKDCETKIVQSSYTLIERLGLALHEVALYCIDSS